jgi:hypothetical protein
LRWRTINRKRQDKCRGTHEESATDSPDSSPPQREPMAT